MVAFTCGAGAGPRFSGLTRRAKQCVLWFWLSCSGPTLRFPTWLSTPVLVSAPHLISSDAFNSQSSFQVIISVDKGSKLRNCHLQVTTDILGAGTQKDSQDWAWSHSIVALTVGFTVELDVFTLQSKLRSRVMILTLQIVVNQINKTF